VTANKALLADSGPELFAKAAARGVAVGFEASVCGGIPVIRALQRGLAGGALPTASAILSDVIEIALLRAGEEASPRLRLARAV